MLEKMTPEVEEAFRYVQPHNLRKTMQNISQLDEIPRQQETQRMKRAMRTSKDFLKASARLRAVAQREGRQDIADRLDEARQRALRGEQSPMEMLKAGGSLLFDALDYPHEKLIRSWTTPERKGDKPGKDVGAVEWAKRIREESDKDDGSIAAKIAMGLASLPGWTIGLPLGGLTAGAGAVSDLVSGREVSAENVWKTASDTAKDVTDFVLMAGTDPLSYLGVAGGGAAKNAMKSTARVLKSRGVAPKEAARLVSEVGEIAAKKAGTADAFEDVISAFRRADIPADEVRKIFGKQGEFFGQAPMRYGLPFIEKAGVELPQITGKEFALAKAMQKGYGKAIKKPIEAVTGSKLRELYDPTKRYAKQAERIAKGAATSLEKKLLDRYTEISLDAPPKERREWIVRNVIDPYRPKAPGAEEALKPIDFEAIRNLEKADPLKLSDELLKLQEDLIENLSKITADTHPERGPRRAARKALRRKAKKDAIETSKDQTLLSQLSSKERKWVNDLDEFFEGVHGEGVRSGFFDAERIAYNQFTGRYFPRQYSRDWGLLDDLPETARAFDPSKTRGRAGAGVELGKTAEHVRAEMPEAIEDVIRKVTSSDDEIISFLDPKGAPGQRLTGEAFEKEFSNVVSRLEANGIDPAKIVRAKRAYEDIAQQRTRVMGEADPHLAVPQYAQRVARGTGAADLEKAFVNAFGVPKTSDVAVGAFGDFRAVGDTGMMLPRDLHTIMRGSFDSSHQTFRNWMSRVPGGKSPAARAIMKGFDWYANLTNFWKRNVLVTRPGYHTLNAWNDSLQMVADGNLRPDRWMNEARKAFRGRGGIDTKIVVDGQEVAIKYSADEVTALAAKYHLPTLDISDTARLEQVGPKAARYRRFEQATLKQRKAAKKKIRKQEGRRLKGDELEARIAQETGQTPMTAAERKRQAIAIAKREPFAVAKEYVGMPGLPANAGEWVAKQWEGHAKLGHFMWRLSKGDSPSMAAARTFDVLLDYQNPSKKVQVARWVFPFATWMMTAPQMTARLVARRPGAVAAVNRFFRAQEGEGHEPGSYVSQRAPFYQMGETGKKVLGAARETVRRGIAPFTGEDPSKITGTGVGPGMSAVWMPREPFGESWTLPLEASGVSSLLQGRGWEPRPELLVGSAAPLPKAIGEQLYQKEALTGKGLERSTPLGVFPSRMPAVPEFLRAAPGGMRKGQKTEETPWGTRYLLPMGMSPAGIAAANMYLYGAGGGEEGGAPLSTIGRIRQYAPPGEAGNIYAQQILNMLTGAPMYTVSPMDKAYEDSRRLRDMQEEMRRATAEAKAMQRARNR